MPIPIAPGLSTDAAATGDNAAFAIGIPIGETAVTGEVSAASVLAAEAAADIAAKGDAATALIFATSSDITATGDQPFVFISLPADARQCRASLVAVTSPIEIQFQGCILPGRSLCLLL